MSNNNEATVARRKAHASILMLFLAAAFFEMERVRNIISEITVYSVFWTYCEG
jgi:hypothetical protein